MPRPVHIPPPMLLKLATPLLKKNWFRELILLPVTLTGKRKSNKTEDYGVFRQGNCRIERLQQLALYVTDIEKSRNWFEELAGLEHSRTCPPEPHPFIDNHTITCCYMSAKDHHECVVLIEHRDANGKLIAPHNKEMFHFAMELEGNKMADTFTFYEQSKSLGAERFYGPARHNDEKPHGDGESGGNVAVYYFTPDWHNVEFCADMDNIDNYIERYGNEKR